MIDSKGIFMEDAYHISRPTISNSNIMTVLSYLLQNFVFLKAEENWK